MKSVILPLFVLFLSFTFISAQLQPEAFDFFLPIITEWVESAIVGYGNNGLLLTYSGESTYEDLVLGIEEIDLFGNAENEWTAQWTDHGTLDVYHLSNNEDNLFIVGPAGTFPVTDYASLALGVPPADLDHDVAVIAENFVDYVDENNVTRLPISELYQNVIVPSIEQFTSQNNAGST